MSALTGDHMQVRRHRAATPEEITARRHRSEAALARAAGDRRREAAVSRGRETTADAVKPPRLRPPSEQIAPELGSELETAIAAGRGPLRAAPTLRRALGTRCR